MTIFLTFNDNPSGIYSSQVIDVVSFLRHDISINIRLVSFISLRGFFNNRKEIKQQLPDAIVLPMYPRMRNWRKNRFLLYFFCSLLSVDQIIARSVLATNLALALKQKNMRVIYDGRGAIEAEWREYSVINDPALLSQIRELELHAIKESQAQLAVSKKLHEFWKEEYGCNNLNSVIIPCTINAVFENLSFTQEVLLNARENLGYAEKDLVFIYSGSVSGWQSFDLLEQFALPLLEQYPQVKFLFLAAPDKNIQRIKDRFPSQVSIYRCAPSQVPSYLMAGDYGLLIREESVTNKVASPVKFGEYLACGLSVIVSEQTGDYSEFVRQYQCGSLLQEFKLLKVSDWKRKRHNRELALTHFTKKEFLGFYRHLVK